jgi:hypothetical protein
VRYVGARQKERDIGGEGHDTSISLLNQDVAEARVLPAIKILASQKPQRSVILVAHKHELDQDLKRHT